MQNAIVSAAAGADQVGAARGWAKRLLLASRTIIIAAIIGLGLTLICAGIGYGLARQSDQSHAAEQRAALRGAIGEFRALFGDSTEIDPRFVRMVEQSAGLAELKFAAEPADGREAQPVLNADGRILGFFTWQVRRPMTQMMNQVMPLIAAMAMGFVAFASLSLWQLQRLRRQLVASEAEARRLAGEDRLTDLPNFMRIRELLDAALKARREGELVSLAIIKLDGARHDHIGASGGDEIIVAFAKALTEALPPAAICGRIGGEKFAVILVADATTNAGDILRAAVDKVSRPQGIETGVRLSTHAGFAQAPRDADHGVELARCAEVALRMAKSKGPRAIIAFAPDIDSVHSDRLFIRRELPQALSSQALELHYQPIVASSGDRIVGVEALLRWNHPTRGPIGPVNFVPMAEQMGLMETLGAFVLRRALTDAKRWGDLTIAVNLSPLQVRDRAIVDLVREVIAETGIEATRVVLEVTEGVLIDNPDEIARRLGDLRALGVRIALDDFGSGYSNLGYLQRFPFDKLKIDKSFVAALSYSNRGVIVQAIVALGRALGVTVLVEGVETEEQRVLLRLAGCDEMQGYLFAKPGPAKAIDRLLARQSAQRGPAAPAKALTA